MLHTARNKQGGERSCLEEEGRREGGREAREGGRTEEKRPYLHEVAVCSHSMLHTCKTAMKLGEIRCFEKRREEKWDGPSATTLQGKATTPTSEHRVRQEEG